MKIWRIGLVLAFAVGVLAGCGGEQATLVDEGGSETVRLSAHGEAYTGEMLDASYPNALSVGNQLALGTMLLEETGHAVTPEQASTLLLLWQALQGGVTAQAEANAVLRQIEETMMPEQLKAIAAMQLTHDDLRTWMQEQGLPMGPGPGVRGDDQRMPPGTPPAPPGEFPGGGEMPPGPPPGPPGEFPNGGEMLPEMATRQAQFAGLSEEERAALQAGALPPPDLLESLIELLRRRARGGAGRPAGASSSRATSTPHPTPTPRSTPTPTPAIVPAETAPASTPATMPTEAPASPSAGAVPAGTSASADVSTRSGASAVELTRLEDSSPGPPFTIEVSAVRIEEDGNYKILGTVRNDGSETYEGIGVIGTFYVEQQCSERYVMTQGPPGQPPRVTVEEVCDPNWYGPVAAYCPCPFLEPGTECPFSLEIYARDYVEYGLHPIGQPIAFFAWHEQASVALNSVIVSNDGVGNVRITGVVVNENEFTVKSVTVAGTLIDANGQIVSVGSTTVPGGIEPGGSASFDLRIKYEPYSRYEVYVQAARY